MKIEKPLERPHPFGTVTAFFDVILEVVVGDQICPSTFKKSDLAGIDVLIDRGGMRPEDFGDFFDGQEVHLYKSSIGIPVILEMRRAV